MSEPKHVAIVGATGAVGEEMRLCLEQRNFPVGKLTVLASARSAGKRIPFAGQDVVVQELTHDSFAGVDIALDTRLTADAVSGRSRGRRPRGARGRRRRT